MSDLIRFGSAPIGRPAERAIGRIASEVAVARAADRARAIQAAGRASDIARVTRHALTAGTQIGIEFESQASTVESNFVRQGLGRIAQAGLSGIAKQIDDLSDPFA